ncbi:MAG: purine phosphoribosyltransferase family protein [Patescibacteria group bacterium]
MDYEDFLRFGKGEDGNTSFLKGDISPFLEDGDLFKQITREMAAPFLHSRIDKVASIEARGFLFAGAIAYILDAGIVMVRKEGKLPMDVLRRELVDYSDKKKTLEIHRDGVRKGERVLVIDDWFETGAQARAATQMIEQLGGIIIGFSVLIDNTTKEARKFFSNHNYHYLVQI